MQRIIRLAVLLVKTFLVGNALVFGFLSALVLSCFILLVIAIAAAMGSDSSPTTKELTHVYGLETSNNKLVSVPIHGLILGSPTEETKVLEVFSDMGITYGYEVKELLAELAEDDEIKGIILDIDSPGGTIFGSQAIADGVAEYKEKTGKPVIAFVSGMAASGGYWSAASADEIMADSGTAIGSIGVITGPFKHYQDVISESSGLLGGGVETTNGISTQYITAGSYKDLGNPYREMSQQEKDTLQESVNQTYAKFVSYVSQQRSIPEETITGSLGALIYGDIQALERKLIDKQLSKDETYEYLALKAGVTDYQVVEPLKEETFVDALLGAYSKHTILSQQAHSCSLAAQPLVFAGSLTSVCR